MNKGNIVQCRFLAILFLTSFLLLAGAAWGASVSTEDGLTLEFRDADAAVTGVRVGGKALKMNGAPGGFYVVDIVADKQLGQMDYHSSGLPGTHLTATARPSPTGVVVQGQV